MNSTPTHVFESSAHEMSPFTVNLHEPDWSITLKPQYGRRHTCLLYTGKAITTAFVCNNVAILLDASLNIDIFPWLKEKVALTDCLHLKPLPSKKKKKRYHMLQTLKVNCSLTYNSGAEALKPQEATSIPSSELAAILSA